MKMMNHIRQWIAELASYSPSLVVWFGIWPQNPRIVEVLVTWVKFLEEPSSYCTVINCTFTFLHNKCFFGFSCCITAQCKLIKHKFTIQTTVLYFDLRPGPQKMLFQGDAPEGSETFQCPVIERDRVGGWRLIIWDKVKVPRCHYSDAPEESDLWTAWQLFPLDDD